MRKWRETAAILLGLTLFLILTYGAAKLLLPVRTVFGAKWDSYHQEERDSLDVLFFGSSTVYCDVIPAVVWQESGLTSYVMAGPEQSLPVTYYYLRQACKTQSPQAVVVELNALFFAKHSELSKPNLLYMPWGVNRLLATIPGSSPEQRLEMFFPLYSLHDRIDTVTTEELTSNLFPTADEQAGYTLLSTAEQLLRRMDGPFDPTTETYRVGMDSLRKISKFCAERDIQLILYLAPIYCNIPQASLDALYRDVDSIPGAAFFDCNTEPWPTFAPTYQWFDCLHLNVAGAVPFSQKLAWKLSSLGLVSEHNGHDALWQSRCDLIEKKLAEALDYD